MSPSPLCLIVSEPDCLSVGLFDDCAKCLETLEASDE